EIRRWKLGEDVLDVRGSDWTDVRWIDCRSVGLTSAWRAVAVCPFCADGVIELAAGHPGVRNGRNRVCVGDDAARFFGEEEERFVALRIELRDVNGAPDGAAKIVIAERWASCAVEIIKVAVRVDIVAAEKLVDAAVKIRGAGAGDDIDLRARRTAGLGVVDAANDAKL